MRILMVGDIFGKAGRRTFAKYTAQLRQKKFATGAAVIALGKIFAAR